MFKRIVAAFLALGISVAQAQEEPKEMTDQQKMALVFINTSPMNLLEYRNRAIECGAISDVVNTILVERVIRSIDKIDEGTILEIQVLAVIQPTFKSYSMAAIIASQVLVKKYGDPQEDVEDSMRGINSSEYARLIRVYRGMDIGQIARQYKNDEIACANKFQDAASKLGDLMIPSRMNPKNK